eukprot:9483739-Alexandrium_andersonii.AAC.1
MAKSGRFVKQVPLPRSGCASVLAVRGREAPPAHSQTWQAKRRKKAMLRGTIPVHYTVPEPRRVPRSATMK